MIISYFPDTHMGLAHRGLKEIAAKHKKNPDALKPGEFLLFMNKKQTAFKLFAAGNVIAYHRSSHRIEPKAITLLPKYFNGAEVDFKGALKEAVERDLRRRR